MQRVFVAHFKSFLSPWQVFQSIERESSQCFFLDSAGCAKNDPAFSYLGIRPFLEVSIHGKNLKVSGREKGIYPAEHFIEVMRRLLNKWKAHSKNYPFFTGGAVGFLGYETARFFEDIHFRKKLSSESPDLYFGFYDEVIIFDHRKNSYHFAVQAENGKSAQESS